ncbi:MAG: lyase family protein [Candidatus Aenigmatarchaeota archaeon]
MIEPPKERTQPRPKGAGPEIDPSILYVGRYGTLEMGEVFGPVQKIKYNLYVQGKSIEVLSRLHPDYVTPEKAAALIRTANVPPVNPDRVRAIEAAKGHDQIAINTVWEEEAEKACPGAGAHTNALKTTADTSEPTNALQFSKGLKIIAGSVENLRDITLERAALDWINISHMDGTHLYDAVPTVVGRPFVHYAEMLHDDLDVIRFVYNHSLVGKWSDITGNHHSATDADIDGMELEEALCRELEIGHMTASAQVPGREFSADVMYSLARTMETVGNLAQYVAWGRSDDVNIFRFPLGKKGSSGMPHKDAKGGNPTTEEQAESFESYINGCLATSMATCNMRYARDLTGSASDRIIFEGAFKCADHAIRGMAEVMLKLQVNEDRSKERVKRSFDVITSPRILTRITDPRKVGNPMKRSEAHDLLGKAATEAYTTKTEFANVLLTKPEITSRIPEAEIRRLTDPTGYIGRSKDIIEKVYKVCHAKKTFPEKTP